MNRKVLMNAYLDQVTRVYSKILDNDDYVAYNQRLREFEFKNQQLQLGDYQKAIIDEFSSDLECIKSYIEKDKEEQLNLVIEDIKLIRRRMNFFYWFAIISIVASVILTIANMRG